MSTRTAYGIPEARQSEVRFLVSVVGVVLFWGLIAFLWPLAISSPIETALALWELITEETALVVDTVTASLVRILVGFLVSLSLGVIVGLAMGMSSRNEDYLYIVVLIGMMIPSLSWAIITLVVLGLSETAIILAIILTTTPFITVTIWEGVKNIDRDLLEMAEIYDISRRDRIRHVIAPQTSPYVFSGARYGLGLCWKITVIVELLGASNGIGYQLNVAFNYFDLKLVFAWTLLLITIMVFIEYGIIRTISTRVFAWREKGAQEWR
jgi:NitT/TauT family transport system permease protein